MTAKNISDGILRAVAIMAGIVLILYFLYEIQAVLAYLAIAAVVALIGRPVVLYLRRKLRMPNIAAVIITMLLMFGLIIGLIALFIPLLTEQGKNLALLDIDELQRNLNKLYWEISDFFRAPPQMVNEIIEEADLEKNMLKGYNLGFIPNFLNSIVNVLSSFSIGLFSVLFISFFFLKDSKMLQRGVLMFIPKQKEDQTINSIQTINYLLSRYFLGLLLQLLVLFVIYMLTLFIVGIENAIVIAFLCALFNVIPYLGPLIGGFLMVVLTMTSNLGADFSTVILPNAGLVLIGIVIGQLVDNFFSQPFIYANSVKSHPMEIFLIIIIAGLLFGVVGMIAAIPVYTAIKVILKEFLSDNPIVKKLTREI